jgi:PEGA domain
MTRFSTTGSTLRRLMLTAALVFTTASVVQAQHGGGGGGSHGGGGGSHGGGAHSGGGGWHGSARNGYYHGGGYHGGYYGRGYYYRPIGWWGWGGWGWGYGWGWGWGWPGYWGGGYGYGSPGYVGVYPYVSASPGAWAVVNTDVSPETTRVFLDGVFIGMSDDFDGPEYLYLKKGDYTLEFRLDGFETKTVNVHANAGAQVKISDKLKKVAGAKHYGSYENPEPEGGVQRFWTKDNNVVHPAAVQNDDGQGGYLPQQGGQSWRGGEYQPPSGDSGIGATMGEGDQPPPSAPATDPSSKSRGRILFRVQPGDAAIYLNDHFIGTGEELSTLARGFLVPPGQHSVTVSRPGMATQERTVVVGPGKSETVEISLQP